MAIPAGPIQSPQADRDPAPLAPRGPRAWPDPVLTVAALGLAALSLVVLNPLSHGLMVRQAAFLGVGVVLMLAFTRLDYSRLRELKWGLYIILIGSILLVLGAGHAITGTTSTRSITVSAFSFQASEFGKVLLVVFLAAFVVDSSRKTTPRELVARVMLLALVPTMLVIAEPDIGSSLVYIAIAVAILYIAGAAWQHLAALALLGIVAFVMVAVVLPAFGVHALSKEMARITAFLHPSANPQSQGWQQHQSTVAIGSGQKFGRGAAASQTKLGLVPEPTTDFIFATISERLGFAGGALVLSLYALIIWRSLRIIVAAKNLFGALIAAGVVAMLLFQVFVNVGVAAGILPITGVTLPLMSYGGSSVLATFLALGLLQSIHVQARVTTRTKGRVLSI
jgi:rod shape determining protein RodA